MHKKYKNLCIIILMFMMISFFIPFFGKSVSAENVNGYIDITKMNCVTYQKNITTYFHNYKYDLDNTLNPYRKKGIQNFTIANLHTDNEIYYFSTIDISYIEKSKFVNASEDEKSAIFNTLILQVKKEDLANTKKGNTVSIPYSGHGQTLQLGENGDSIWTNCDAGKITTTYGTQLNDFYKLSKNKYYGSKNYGISEYKMNQQDFDISDKIIPYGNSINREVTKICKKQRLHVDGKFLSELKSYIDYDYIVEGQQGKLYKGREAGTWDKVCGTMSLIQGKDAYIVNFTNKARNIKDYLYKFELKRKYYDKEKDIMINLHSQGYSLDNGYFYEYLNDDSSKYLYISCYSIDGKLQYMQRFDGGENIEAEGMQIINGELFIGIRNKDNNKFTIGTFVTE